MCSQGDIIKVAQHVGRKRQACYPVARIPAPHNGTMTSLKGRVVLITGAAKRIGRGIAIRLAREGAHVAIHYNGSEAEARATAAECADAPIFQADLERVSEIERLFEDVHRHFGRIDGLVNNAARFTRIDPLEVTEADWDFIHSVNLKATFFCCQQAAKRMIPATGGRIVNISSLGGIRPWAHHAHYCASKAGAIMLTRALAKAFAPKVTVNSVAPGVIPFGPRDERVTRLIAATPACREGTADEIADAVVFFLTASNFVTGQIMAVDGGLSLR
jgi:NAD(P)-dependent dehydrogenase (short-subunit alcohol dehydrogenase family)